MGAFVNLLKAIARTLGVDDQGTTPYTPPQTANTYGSINLNPNAGREPPQGQRTNAFGQPTDAFQAASRVAQSEQFRSSVFVGDMVYGDQITVVGDNSIGKIEMHGNGSINTGSFNNFGDGHQDNRGVTAVGSGGGSSFNNFGNGHQDNRGAVSVGSGNNNSRGNQSVNNSSVAVFGNVSNSAIAIGNNARASSTTINGGSGHIVTSTMGDHSSATTTIHNASQGSSVTSNSGTHYQAVSGGKHHGGVLLDSATPAAPSASPVSQQNPTFGAGNSFGSFNNFGDGHQDNRGVTSVIDRSMNISGGNHSNFGYNVIGSGNTVAIGENASASSTTINGGSGHNVVSTMGDHSPAKMTMMSNGNSTAPVQAAVSTMGDHSPAKMTVMHNGNGTANPAAPVKAAVSTMGNHSPAKMTVMSNGGGAPSYNGATPPTPPTANAAAGLSSRGPVPTR